MTANQDSNTKTATPPPPSKLPYYQQPALPVDIISNQILRNFDQLAEHLDGPDQSPTSLLLLRELQALYYAQVSIDRYGGVDEGTNQQLVDHVNHSTELIARMRGQFASWTSYVRREHEAKNRAEIQPELDKLDKARRGRK